jgi:hypothetical protein
MSVFNLGEFLSVERVKQMLERHEPETKERNEDEVLQQHHEAMSGI